MTKTMDYDYAVRDRAGKMVKGRLKADSPAMVATKLKSMGYAPVSITEANAGIKRDISIPGFGNKIGLKDLAIMSRQFATMINAGLSLLRSLTILEEQTECKPLAKVLAQVRAEVEGGKALSEAMAAHPKVFPPLMVNMCRAGEVGGFLDQSLLQIASNYESEVRLRGKVKSAMTYPVVVAVMAVLGVTRHAALHRPHLQGDVRLARRDTAGADAFPGVPLGTPEELDPFRPCLLGDPRRPVEEVQAQLPGAQRRGSPEVEGAGIRPPLPEDRNRAVHQEPGHHDPLGRPNPPGPGHRGGHNRQCGRRECCARRPGERASG